MVRVWFDMDSDGAVLLVSSPLRFFLPVKKRGPEVPVPSDGTSTVGHALSAVGVPKTEVGDVLVGSRRVDLGYRPRPGDRISVLAVSRPQSAPTSPPRFVLDVHLGTLARRMRLLGLDAAYDRRADDEALLQTSLTEQRVLLTRDRGLLHRRAVRWGAHIDHQAPDDQVREVLDRFAPSVHPWTRCPLCNGTLHDVDKSHVQEQLPAGTRRSYERFRRCAACGQIYWHGAHGDGLQSILDAASR